MNKTKDYMALSETEFEKLFKTKFKPLAIYAYKYLKDTDLAKEIVHQAFIKLWQNRQNIDMNNNVSAYLYRTVNNLSLNYIRDRKKFVSTEEIFEWDVAPTDFENIAVRNEVTQAIVAAIDKLPPKMREVFILSRYENMSHKEIAQKLGISTKTVENQINKALKRLRKDLKIYI